VLRVGVFCRNLSSDKPRGVARVARALAEQLSQNAEIETYALEDPFYDIVDVLVEHYELRDYLARVPLKRPARKKLTFVKRSLREAKRRMRAAAERSVIAGFAAGIVGVTVRKNKKEHRVAKGWRQRPLSLGPISLSRLDVIVSFEAFEDIWDWPVETLQCKMMGFAHDTIPLRIDEGPKAKPDHFYRAVAKFALRADRIVCVSRSTERDMHSFYPGTVGKTIVIHNGHDLARFARPSAASVRNREQRRRILMLGDMDRRKNVQTVLRAMPLLATKDASTRIELALAGNPSQRRHFADLECNAAKYVDVEWLGFVPDEALPELYASADVFVFPSLWEGFGIPVLEAMSAGVPVVCSDLSSLPEVAGPHGWYCDPYDPQSIADALTGVLSMDDDERREWVAAARAWAAQFTWERAGKQLADVIFDMTGTTGLQAWASTERSELMRTEG
jgi:glycosyltransferase involved in cell wall biosynthesis